MTKENKQDFSGLFNKVRQHADEYAKSRNITLTHGTPTTKVDEKNGASIAQAYEKMPHTPNDPQTKKAYDALINETADQYNHIRSKGVNFSKMGDKNAYLNGSKDVFKDLHENNHMHYYPTEQGFGSDISGNKDHPMLKQVQTSDGPMIANDVFRIVHDYFGHAKEGHQFGPSGEDAAWKAHMQMYSPEAQRALTSETRGQNSWVNFGPHGKSNRKDPSNTVYADQKAGLMPDWTMGINKMGKSETSYHPATHGGHHFIFSPEKPRGPKDLDWSPDQVKHYLENKLGETIEDTHGKYGSHERSFIVHDPKNIEKLHQLASKLGQESSVESKDGQHEMHYYHGHHAGHVRLGHGTEVYDEQPDDNYTRTVTPDGNAKFFSHSFDWDDKNLKPMHKNELPVVIAEALGKSLADSYKYQRYWNFILDGVTDSTLEKSLSIRTENRVFVSMDGDNIGASVERAAMADDLETIIAQSEKISNGQKMIRQWAQAYDADIYLDGGDDLAFTLPASATEKLDELRKAYFQQTGYTITIGWGDSISRAGHAMLYGKLKGKNQINAWSDAVAKELESISRQLSPTEKLQEHGLIKDTMSEADKISSTPANQRTPAQQKAHSANVRSTQPTSQVHANVDSGSENFKISTTGPFTTAASSHNTTNGNRNMTGSSGSTTLNVKDATPSMKNFYAPKAAATAGMAEAASGMANMNQSNYAPATTRNIPGSGNSNSSFITSASKETAKSEDLYYDLEKALGPPSKPGEKSHNGRYIAQHHKPAGMIAWRNNDEISKEHDQTIDSNKSAFVDKHPKEHHGVIGGLIDNVRKDFHRHFIIARDKNDGDNKIRARHIKNLVSGKDGYNIKVHSPDRLTFTAERHGSRPRTDVWSYDHKTKRISQVKPGSPNKLRKNENTRLVHYSTQSGLDSIDPAKMGSGLGARGNESKRGRPGVERSYWYREGTDTEPLVTSQAKARYTSELGPDHKIYDISEDPDNIYSKLKDSGKTANAGLVTSDEYLGAVKEAGYHGFHNPKSSLSNVVALFHPHPAKEDEVFNKAELEKSKNVREQRAKVFGKDPNAPRMSPNRQKMMQHIKDQTKEKVGLDMEIASGKRDSDGELRDQNPPVNKQPFDIFTEEGHAKEKERQAHIKDINVGRKESGEIDIRRADPKPDWRSGDLETQPIPDAAIHELAHLMLAPENQSLPETQEWMDWIWGESQSKHGHAQQKKTYWEIQPMALENKIRRRLGLPSTAPIKNKKPLSEHDRPVERALDYDGNRFTRGLKGSKGKQKQSVDYDRSSRLLTPENQQRLDQIDRGELIYDKDKGWIPGTSINARINVRSRQKEKEGVKDYFLSKLYQAKAKRKVADTGSDEEPLAMSTDAKLAALKQKYTGGNEPAQVAFQRRVNEVKRNFRAGQSNPKNDPAYVNTRVAARDMKVNKKGEKVLEPLIKPNEKEELPITDQHNKNKCNNYFKSKKR